MQFDILCGTDWL